MRTSSLVLLTVGLTLATGPLRAQSPAEVANAEGMAAMRQNRWVEAEARFATAAALSVGDVRSEAAFLRAYAVFRQGEALARDNAARDRQVAARARQHFERVLILLRETNHPRRPLMEEGTLKYIANLEEIMGRPR